MNDDRKKEEKERLMKEVLGKKRAYEDEDNETGDDIKLSMNDDAPKETDSGSATIKKASDAMKPSMPS